MLTLDHSPVHSDPELMGGTLVFRATRVPAQTLLDYLDDGYSIDESSTCSRPYSVAMPRSFSG